MLGKNPHNDSEVLGLAEKVTFRTNQKSSAENDKTITARALVEKEILDGDPQDHLPNPVTLTRMINRLRLKQRPKEPKTLSCDIFLNYIDLPENFMVADIKMEDNSGIIIARHIIYATPNQISLLRQASTWLV